MATSLNRRFLLVVCFAFGVVGMVALHRWSATRSNVVHPIPPGQTEEAGSLEVQRLPSQEARLDDGRGLARNEGEGGRSDGRGEATTIRVIDEWGEPVGEASVYLHSNDPDASRMVLRSSTDQAGIVEFRGDDDLIDEKGGPLPMRIKAASFLTVEDGFDLDDLGRESTIRLQHEVDFELPVLVEGDLRFERDDLSVTFDEGSDGLHVMAVHSRRKLIELRALVSELPTEVRVQLMGGPVTSVHLPKPGTREERLLRLDPVELRLPGARVSGKVVLKGGQALGNLEFRLRSEESGGTAAVRTDDRGRFELDGTIGGGLVLSPSTRSSTFLSLRQEGVPARWGQDGVFFEFPDALLHVDVSELPSDASVRLMVQTGDGRYEADGAVYGGATWGEVRPTDPPTTVLCPPGETIRLHAREEFLSKAMDVLVAERSLAPLRVGEVRTVDLEVEARETVELVVPHFDGVTRTEFVIRDPGMLRRIQSRSGFWSHGTGEPFRLPPGSYRISWFEITESPSAVPTSPDFDLEVHRGMTSTIVPELAEPGKLELTIACNERDTDDRGHRLSLSLLDAESEQSVSTEWTRLEPAEVDSRWKGVRCQSTVRSSCLPPGPLLVRISRSGADHRVDRPTVIRSGHTTTLQVECPDRHSDD